MINNKSYMISVCSSFPDRPLQPRMPRMSLRSRLAHVPRISVVPHRSPFPLRSTTTQRMLGILAHLPRRSLQALQPRLALTTHLKMSYNSNHLLQNQLKSQNEPLPGIPVDRPDPVPRFAPAPPAFPSAPVDRRCPVDRRDQRGNGSIRQIADAGPVDRRHWRRLCRPLK
jgi:hypothetical protein